MRGSPLLRYRSRLRDRGMPITYQILDAARRNEDTTEITVPSKNEPGTFLEFVLTHRTRTLSLVFKDGSLNHNVPIGRNAEVIWP